MTVGPYVVGLNCSVGARRALSWAYGVAARDDVELEVVTAAPILVTGYGLEFALPLSMRDMRDAARANQDDIVREVLGDDATDPRIERVVLAGPPLAVLVRRSDAASLLVVGRPDHRLHVGRSLTTRLTAAARCPVVVVGAPPPRETRKDRRSLRQLRRELERAEAHAA
jgi:hypothetical protein